MILLVSVAPLFALIAYLKKRPSWVLFFIFLRYGCFGFVETAEISSITIKMYDIVIILITLLEWKKNKDYFKVYNSRLSWIIKAIVIFLTFEFVYTSLLDLESPRWAYNVFLKYFTFLLFFYVRNINIEDIRLFLKIMLVGSVVHGFFFYIQFLGIDGFLVGRIEDGELSRYCNGPRWASFFILYCFFNDRISWFYRLFLLSFFLPVLFLALFRTSFIALGVCFAMYLVTRRQIKYTIFIVVGAVLLYGPITQVFQTREDSGPGTSSEEVFEVLRNPMSIYKNYSSGSGTFIFRTAMTLERVNYLIENPRYAPLGIGYVLENSDHDHYNFSLGTQKGDTGLIYRLESNDVDWMEIVIRFGFVGSVLFLFMILFWIYDGSKLVCSTSDPLYVTAAISSAGVLLSTFSSGPLQTDSLYRNIILMGVVASYYLYLNKKKSHEDKDSICCNK